MAKNKASLTSIRDDEAHITKGKYNLRRTNDDTINLNGEGTAGDRVKIYDGKKVIGTTTVNQDGTWSFDTPELSNGVHFFQIRTLFEQGGRSQKSGRRKIVVDTKIQEIDDFSLQAGNKTIKGEIEQQQIKILGKAEKGASVDIYDNGVKIGTATANKKGNFKFFMDKDLAPGEHSITLVHKDLAGNVSNQGKASLFTVAGDVAPDTAPTVNEVMVNSESFTLTGQASLQDGDTLTIHVNGNDYSSSDGLTISGNQWSLSMSAAGWDKGSYEVTATISNAAGSISDSSNNELTIASGTGLGQAGVDTDGDEVMDDVDIDDDNDGILDIVEGDGDADRDGIANYLDLDSDGDGIADNIEAQTSSGWVEGFLGQDADFDGLNDAYDADNSDQSAAASRGLSPENTDNDTLADYLDKDSDNDGKLDVDESGIPLINFSTDYFNTTGGFFPSDLANNDGGTEEKDYREAAITTGSPIGPVTDVNSQENEVLRDVAIGSVVGITAEASDPDLTDTVSYSLHNDANGRFGIDSATGIVTTLLDLGTAPLTDYTIGITAHSSDSSTSQGDFTITLLDPNRPIGPVNDTDARLNQIVENASVGTKVGLVALAIDPDSKDTVSYSLTDDANGRFSINSSTGVVKVAGALDHSKATSHDVEVTATSSDASQSVATFTIDVLDFNRPIGPVKDIDTKKNEVSETITVGSSVHITAKAIDPDSKDTVRYSLFDDANGYFNINKKTGVVTLAKELDYATDQSHQITVKATSSDGTVSSKNFTVDVTENQPIGPVTDTNTTANEVSEHAQIGAQVHITANAIDPDSSDTVSYQLLDDAGGLFTIDSDSGVVTVAGKLDYETKTSHQINVGATSSDGSTSEAVMNIDVANEQFCAEFTSNPSNIHNIFTNGSTMHYSGTSNAPSGTVLTVQVVATEHAWFGRVYKQVGFTIKYQTTTVQDDGTWAFTTTPARSPTYNVVGGNVYQFTKVYIADPNDISKPADDSCVIRSVTNLENRNPAETPLILDMDGNGVQTLGLAVGTQFDIDADGTLDNTGWVDQGDALLVRDINKDGQINDGSELFGSRTIKQDGSTASDGFDALRDIDSNRDGIFNADDKAFDEIKIWKDANSDGVVQEGELLSLTDANIEEIKLEAIDISEDNQGNVAGLRSSWSDTNGNSHDIDDIWFAYESGAANSISDADANPLLLNENTVVGYEEVDISNLLDTQGNNDTASIEDMLGGTEADSLHNTASAQSSEQYSVASLDIFENTDYLQSPQYSEAF